MTPPYVVLLGAPGSGKGTQSQLLLKHHNFVHISTGDLLRDSIKSDSELGLSVKSYVDSGNLVPDTLIISLVKECLINNNAKDKGFILDGFPRTLNQADALSELLVEMNIELNSVISFDLDLDSMIDRISGRRICSHCGYVFHISTLNGSLSCSSCGSKNSLYHRSDDTPEKIKHRYAIYTKETEPLISYYSDKVFSIDASQSPDNIQHLLRNYLFN